MLLAASKAPVEIKKVISCTRVVPKKTKKQKQNWKRVIVAFMCVNNEGIDQPVNSAGWSGPSLSAYK